MLPYERFVNAPQVTRHQLQLNLNGLCQSLESYAKASGIAAPKPPSPIAHLSDSLYLAHSTSDEKFSNINASGRLSSAASLAASHRGSLRPSCAEVVLGTADSVFFYVSPFRYPNTSCGLLFAASLESHHGDDGAASPFDSGGLIEICVRHDPTEPPREFLSRHELPLPEHRELSVGMRPVANGNHRQPVFPLPESRNDRGRDGTCPEMGNRNLSSRW